MIILNNTTLLFIVFLQISFFQIHSFYLFYNFVCGVSFEQNLFSISSVAVSSLIFGFFKFKFKFNNNKFR